MPDTTASSSDPLFGNNASDLMRGAIDPATHVPTGDPRAWQPPEPEDLQARLGGGYLIEAFLARGGMGAVYRGIQASLERPVAIKILPPQLRDIDPSFAERFKQEAKAMAQLNHPSIVSVYDFGEMEDGTLYFIMEFIEGKDVAQMVARQGRLSSAHAMAITAHVCDALQYAHENGVVHRDIKPANIMVANDGRVKVADFGLAKSSRVTNSSLTMTGHVMGTPHFLAPEALTLGSSVDHRADIYAMGVMFYQMLTGRLPQGIFEMPSMLVPGLDPRYDHIIASAMREDRSVRYQAILDMRRALDAILTQPVRRSEIIEQHDSAPQAVSTSQATQQSNHLRQTRKTAPPVQTKSNTTTSLLAAALVLMLGGIAWMKWTAQPRGPLPAATDVLSPSKAAESPGGIDKDDTHAAVSKQTLSQQTKPTMELPVEEGFVPLLDKDHHAGWKYKGPSAAQVRGDGVTLSDGFYWYEERVLRDFILRLDFWVATAEINGGVFIRVPEIGAYPRAGSGYEIEINGSKTGTFPWINDKLSGTPPIKLGEWNSMEIAASGQEIRVRLNHVLINKHIGNRKPSGYIALQGYTGATQFRNVRIKELPSAVVAAPATVAAVATTPDARPEARIFTDSRGRQILATLIRVQNDDVTLNHESGREFTIKAATLSAADIEYLKTKGLVMPQVSTLETVWKNRCNPAERIAMLARTGGVKEVEAGVSAAFEYLKHKQNRDGSWGTDYRVGNSALALLAYAGRCETIDSSLYGDTIMKGILFLIETGKKNSQGAFVTDSTSGYDELMHATATEALGQMYLAARYGSKSLPGMREAFEKGVRHIIESNPALAEKAKSSIHALTWQCEVLNTAKLTGLKFAGLDECIDRTVNALRALQNAGGGFEAPPEKPGNITGACLRVLQLSPDGNQEQIEKGIRFARQHFQRDLLKREEFNFHDTLFYTRAFYRRGGNDWRFWNVQMLPAMLSKQKPDGSFSSSPSSRGQSEEINDTAMGVLILEIYYRGALDAIVPR